MARRLRDWLDRYLGEREATLTADQRRQWSLALQGNNVNKKGLEISFGLKGDPWVPFREVPR